MRITIQVTCDTPEEAQEAVARLTRKHATWDEQMDKLVTTGVHSNRVNNSTPVSATRVDEIMKAPVRPNVSPGEPSIGKIGKENVDMLVKAVKDGNTKVLNDTDKWQEHLKLLWKRSLVKYDSEEYYL